MHAQLDMGTCSDGEAMKGVWHSLGTGREWEEVGSYCVYEGKKILLFIYLRMLSIKTERTGSSVPQVLNF